MKSFDVQGIELMVPRDRAFAYIADPRQLPHWTRAFAAVDGARARLRTPAGETEINLEVQADGARGTIDWILRFPDGSIGRAYSRVTAISAKQCVYSFVLTPPPVPLEQLEGALAEQSRTLAAELNELKHILETND